MNTKFYELLGLKAQERKILKYLTPDSNVSVSDISTDTNIPRMTVYLVLDSLKHRGLADYKRIGKRRFWNRLSDIEIARLVSELVRSVHDESKSVEIRHNDQSQFVVSHGLKNLFSIFERIAKGHKGERLIGMQPTSSMKHVVKKLSWSTLLPIQQAIRDNKIIVEGMVREDYYPTLLSLLNSDEERKSAIDSFSGRLNDMVFVSNEYLKSETELMMFKDVAFLVNWKDEVAVEIKNTEKR
jgi:predicted transcriptional regulator